MRIPSADEPVSPLLELPDKVYKFAHPDDKKSKEAKSATSKTDHGGAQKGNVELSDDASASSDDEYDDSDEDDDMDEEEPVRRPGPCDVATTIFSLANDLPQLRSETCPDDPAAAAAWRTIGIVRIEPDRTGGGAQAVKDFAELITKEVWPEFKQATEKLKAVAKDDPNFKKVEKELEVKREKLLQVVKAAYETGKPNILESMGPHQRLVANLLYPLRYCLARKDVTSPLPMALLRLLSKFRNIDAKVLRELKFDQLNQRYMVPVKDGEVDDLVKKILANRAEQQRDQKPDGTVPDKNPPMPGTAKTEASAPKRVASDQLPVKRPRDDDSDTKVAKKIATSSANGTPQASAAKPAPTKSVTPVPAPVPNKPWVGSTLLPGKSRPAVKPVTKAAPVKAEPPKTAHPATKPEAAKATTAAKREAMRADPLKPEPAKVKQPAPTRDTTKLAALLDEIAKPTPVAKPAPTPAPSLSEKPETPEEKARRLRKESRRKLRVTWKDDSELTEVRIFHKHADEDAGREQNLVRDARDNRSEAMAFSLALKTHAAELGDEEEDDIPDREWVAPTPFDFSPINAAKRSQTYATRGGDLAVGTDEQKVMAARENNVHMVVYTQPSDIPPSPKSPPRGYSDPSQPPAPLAIPFLPSGDPKFAETAMRWEEIRTQGPQLAAWNAMQRAGQHQRHRGASAPGLTASVHAYKTAAPGAGHGFQGPQNGDEVLKLLQSDRAKHWKAPNLPRTHRRHDYADPAAQRDVDAVEDVAATLKD